MIEQDTTGRRGAPGGAAAAPWGRFVVGGILAAALAAGGNLAWRAAYTSVTGNAVPDLLGVTEVVTASTLSVLLAAGIYLLLARGLTIATPLYIVGCLITAAASCVAPLTPVLPDGSPPPPWFPLVAMPMHLFAGLMAAVVVPLVVLRNPRR